MYQGDPLSVTIFNAVMATLADTIDHHKHLGYKFTNSPRSTNILPYADDTCLIADGPSSCTYLWKKKPSPNCPLCGDQQTTLPTTATWRPRPTINFWPLQEDPCHPCLPLAITSTDLRPDIVIWSQALQSAILVELTVCYETNYIQAQTRKLGKYQDLVDEGSANGYTMRIITLEVGSRGFLNMEGFKSLISILTGATRRVTWQLLKSICRTTILQSHRLWVSRNTVT